MKFRDLSEISRGEGGGDRRRVTTFETAEKGEGHANMCP